MAFVCVLSSNDELRLSDDDRVRPLGMTPIGNPPGEGDSARVMLSNGRAEA